MGSKSRIGIGYDIHPLTAGRKLVLGGVEIPFDRGLSGWSDGDVLIHAIIDAMLGAASLGDIGQHFPPGEPEYRGISSLVLLGRTREILAAHGYSIGNVDATVVAESPRLAPHIPGMRQNLSRVLGVPTGRVSVKASTNNGIGEIGKNEAICAYAVVMLEGGDHEAI
ncbi:MAG: 2-C-methyl-D-erythritol 2,4-cyclodiphosphate synthase [Dehalococcoidales bacterium]|nr:2-C-methyl-D-erythritol 2,4-cyclodiphosphate synthase [Dehalococcoidales bacterium]